ncbi:DUF1236 domain-containing protein [Aquabacter spiritensis]|uniref:Uncharacterized protein DUF1236 n=1 Tax=Aquabacter spiritensis TaxID=933073 RepID=A0A4R3LTG2_9HYPH|nr:DUF1236 domain-containing protein [Aquabacter spiritensis]TCT03176.1 uncharacterized protein DUF1236 [Aquabacter spiritensis]
MRNRIVAAAAALAMLTPSLAFAQASTATGAVGGAAVGAVVGGPVGAVVGGAVGATMGAAAEPPQAVRTYVVQESRPSVRMDGQVVVGEPLPRTVEVYSVPNYNQYGYTVVNEQRVIVDPNTRRVIQVVP